VLDSLSQYLFHATWLLPSLLICLIVLPYLGRIMSKRKRTTHAKQMSQLLNNTIISQSNQLTSGYVCVKGKLSPVDQTLVSPFSQRPCSWYLCSITMVDKKSKTQEIIYFNRSIRLCYLEDKTGKVVIYPLNAKAYLDQLKPEKKRVDNLEWYDSFFSEEKLSQLKQKRNATEYIISETIIPIGTEVSVLGFLNTKRKSDSLFFQDPKMASNTPKQKLVSADQAVNMTWYHAKDIALPINDWDKVTQSADTEKIDVIMQYNATINNPMIISTLAKDTLAARLVKK